MIRTSRHIRRLIVAAAAFVSSTLAAQETCPPAPEKYRSLPFGDVRFAVEEECRRTFTREEQFYLAGVAQALSIDCKLPRDRERAALVQRFAKAARLSLELQKPEGALDDGLRPQSERAAAFAAGVSMMEDIRCNGAEAALLARGIALYLERIAGSSRFVAGCVEHYAKRYTAQDCRCIADALRPLLPDVDQRFFDRELVKESIHRSPRVALTLMFSCGVADY